MTARRIVLLCSLALAAAVASAQNGDEPPPVSDPGTRAVHGDSAEVERALVSATLAFLHEDPKEARAALDRLHVNSRPLQEDEGDIVGSDVLTYDRAFHVTLNRARELAGAGDIDGAFDQFVWVQRACRTCHALARERGLMERPPVN